MQSEDGAENKISRDGISKGNSHARFENAGEIARQGPRYRKQGKMGLEAGDVEIQEKIQNYKKNKHNVHLLKMLKIKIPEKRPQGRQAGAGIK